MQDHPQTAVLVAGPDGVERVACRLPPGPPDLALLDALLRCRLDAARHGRTLRLRDPSRELLALLELCGLGGVLGLEARGEPELREELGADEVVQPDDRAG